MTEKQAQDEARGLVFDKVVDVKEDEGALYGKRHQICVKVLDSGKEQ